MEQRIIKSLILKNYTDQVQKYTFLKVLTEETVEIVKLSTSLESKSKNIFSPSGVYTMELVKTRKNWIVKSILKSEKLCIPQNFIDFLLLAELIKLIEESLKVEESTTCLSFILEYFQNNPIENCNLQGFNKNLQTYLGYI